MKRLISVAATGASGAVLYWVPPLAWGIGVSCILIAMTACVLVTWAFFDKSPCRRNWIIKLIVALRRGS